MALELKNGVVSQMSTLNICADQDLLKMKIKNKIKIIVKVIGNFSWVYVKGFRCLLAINCLTFSKKSSKNLPKLT